MEDKKLPSINMKMLNVEETASVFKLSKGEVYKAFSLGVPHVKNGRQTLVRYQDFKDYLTRNLIIKQPRRYSLDDFKKEVVACRDLSEQLLMKRKAKIGDVGNLKIEELSELVWRYADRPSEVAGIILALWFKGENNFKNQIS